MGSPVIPTYHYHDAAAATEFLIEAFGFERHLVVESDDGVIEHAELTIGDGMIMVGTHRENEYGQLVTTVGPAGKPTSAAYVIVDDPCAHAERARAAGAEIVMEPADQDYGGANYTARDPEGNLWNFGSYDPWAAR